MEDETQFINRYDRLNPQQKQAVDTIEGPLMVIAGPGSGKTELLGLRVVNILRHSDTEPRSILCLTFTDSAAINMRKRLESLIGASAYRVSINTFHTFGVWLIDRYREHFYGGARLQPADNLTQIELMDEIIRDMDHDDPLRSYHPDKGYVYMQSAIQAISDLKKAGLTPDDFSQIVTELAPVYERLNTIIVAVFSERISKSRLGQFTTANEEIKSLISHYEPGSPAHALITEISSGFDSALSTCLETDKTKHITAWKSQHLTKVAGEWILKASAGLTKLTSMSQVYKKYLDAMYTAGYYDFDDMILESLVALRTNPDLRAEVQEQFQYILVDEFQDTNEAQMEIIKHLTSAESHNGRPNVMVVGDDDQAIYRFQGAEIGNLVKFTNFYDQVDIITLQENYRSTTDIVDLSMSTIKRGTARIENFLPEVQKEIKAFNADTGFIQRVELPSQAHEFTYIAREIQRLIDNEGVEPRDIAIIGRRHKTLEALVTYLQRFKIPTRYERQLDVLQEVHIQQIITIIRLLEAITAGDNDKTDELLSEVVFYPFWDFDPLQIWQLSVTAHQSKSSWLDTMLDADNEKIQSLAKYLITLAARSKYEPVEIIIDEIVGTHVTLVPDDPDAEIKSLDNNVSGPTDQFFSGFKDFYFSADQYRDSKAKYLSFLSSLRVFVAAIREYRQGQMIKTTDLIRFVDIHQENERLVADTSPFINATNAVNVITAHKAKGLEFKVVLVTNCIQKEWVKTRSSRDFAWPGFLNIGNDPDTNDDKLRLFYVAMTRAIERLYFTGFTHDDTGKEVEPLEFLSGIEITPHNNIEVPSVSDILDAKLSSRFQAMPELETNALLKELLVDYQLSVTHLNNFIDVTRGGPQAFLEQNLLRFPHAKTASGSYGTAIHNTLDQIIRGLGVDTTFSLAEAQELFTEFLTAERMSREDFRIYQQRGVDELAIFYPQFVKKIDQRDISELNFRNQNVVVDGVHLTGKIDWLHYVDGKYEIRDFKTGKPVSDWQGKQDYEKIKLHKYRQQLLFYKLLIDNSREYAGTMNLMGGVIDFIQPSNNEIVSLALPYDDAELEQLQRLIKAVHHKIVTLEFDDVSAYSKNYQGILDFEKDLIS